MKTATIDTGETDFDIPRTLDALPKHPNVGVERFSLALGDGKLIPGETVTQAELCEALGLSLSPLRETLVLLEEYGLVEVKPRAGVLIANPEMDFLRESYQFRILIEVEALKAYLKAVPRHEVEALLDRQAEIIKDLRDDRSEAAIESFVACDYFLHTRFVEAMGNKHILATHNRLQLNLRNVRSLHRSVNFVDNLLTAGQEHLDLLDRIAARDIDGAQRVLRRHFESSAFRVFVAP